MDLFGIDDGTVSKASKENHRKAKALLNQNKPQEAVPFLMKAFEDPYNLDACTTIAIRLPPEPAIACLKVGEATGREHLKRVLAPDCFEDNASYGAPHFWGIYGTRPYMRLLGAIVRIHVHAKQWDKAATQNLEILRLCESDNMGQRSFTSALLLHAGCPSDALWFAQQWLHERNGGDLPLHSGIRFGTPSREPRSESEIKGLARYVDLQMIYSAALAAFMLYGDCELARQYLHIAVQYPHVMIKVIGRFKERLDVDTHPVRIPNGVEDARDHLWLAQDLWSREDVWNWVNSDPVVRDAVLRLCSDPACRKKEERVAQWQKCAGCKQEWYCSRTCQKGHWPEHRERCKREQQRAAEMNYY